MTSSLGGRLARWGGRTLAALAVALVPAAGHAAHPFAVPLRDGTGAVLDAASTAPYSPERSCGGCHDFATITQGYHFQQGRTDGAAHLNVSDSFAGALMIPDGAGDPTKGTGAWWKLSDGMYGKW
jgi:hypothetical protein